MRVNQYLSQSPDINNESIPIGIHPGYHLKVESESLTASDNFKGQR
jgi:hypothetical protein